MILNRKHWCGRIRLRLDLFLKTSRLVKRRTLAQEFCQMGLIDVNGIRAKSSKNVSSGDRIKLSFGSKVTEIEILEIPQGNVPARDAHKLYRLLSEEQSP